MASQANEQSRGGFRSVVIRNEINLVRQIERRSPREPCARYDFCGLQGGQGQRKRSRVAHLDGLHERVVGNHGAVSEIGSGARTATAIDIRCPDDGLIGVPPCDRGEMETSADCADAVLFQRRFAAPRAANPPATTV